MGTMYCQHRLSQESYERKANDRILVLLPTKFCEQIKISLDFCYFFSFIAYMITKITYELSHTGIMDFVVVFCVTVLQQVCKYCYKTSKNLTSTLRQIQNIFCRLKPTEINQFEINGPIRAVNTQFSENLSLSYEYIQAYHQSSSILLVLDLVVQEKRNFSAISLIVY